MKIHYHDNRTLHEDKWRHAEIKDNRSGERISKHKLSRGKTMTRRALITGITGQDGTYLAKLLLEKGHEVHGIQRQSSTNNTSRLREYLNHDFDRVTLHYGDMTDATNLLRIVEKVEPDEVYNLAAQSHVHVSFSVPEYTANVDALGTLRLLEALRISGADAKYYQASTSELFGNAPPPQSEKTPLTPRSPYAVAKLYAYWVAVNYRESYNMSICNGILFNHESPFRGEMFVTRKVTQGVARMEAKLQNIIRIGNLNAKRDWGHAEDYVEGMWLMLQQNHAEDYVLATGESHSVREWVEHAFAASGRMVRWTGSGIAEKGIDSQTGEPLVEIDPKYFRPSEVDHLCGDATKARNQLGWRPKHSFASIVKEMVEYDRNQIKRGVR